MKTEIFWKCTLGLALALPLATGCAPESANSAPVISSATNDETTVTETVVVTETGGTNASMPAVEPDLENAPGEVVSEMKPPANLKLSATANEVAKLAQAGVDESVMLAFVTNSTWVFKLSSDDIIYLNDLGVPGTVVTAMLQRDEAMRVSTDALAYAPPPYTNQLVPAPGAPIPYPLADSTAVAEVQPQPTEVVEYVQPPQDVNVSYNYFYDSLAPYGTWINIGGYGRCWRPVAAVNPGWQPYCDRGRWVYSDCGWYWASDYSWGWGPFHYGRWFCSNRFGWCWAPGTVWGPSWVSWRSSPGYCGWAPLPPTAAWAPGVGFSYRGRQVGVNFGFGLTANRYTFVPAHNFYDPYPSRHRLAGRNVTQVFNNTVVVNEIVQDNHHRIVNRGIPVRDVATLTHTEIRPVPVRDAGIPAGTRLDRGEGGRPTAIYRPNLPEPEAGTPVAGEVAKSNPRRELLQTGRAPLTIHGDTTTANAPAQRRAETTTISGNQPLVPTQNDTRRAGTVISPSDSRTTPPAQRNAPVILRGSDRAATAIADRPTTRPRIWPAPGANNATRPAPDTSAQSTAPAVQPTAVPAQNNLSQGNPRRQFSVPAPQSQPQVYTPSPSPAPQPNQGNFRQEIPRTQPPAQGGFSQPTAPAQRQPAMPTYQSPRAAEAREPQTWGNPARSAPAPRPDPAPRVETRQAPPQPAPSSPQNNTPASRPSSDNSNPHRNR